MVVVRLLFAKINNTDDGFSLIELMLVVAIAGMLAAVAVPSFQRFVYRARQVEAKSSLSAGFLAEKVFVGEFSTYTGCLESAGLDIPLGTRRYVVGFEDSRADANVCGNGTQSCFTADFGAVLTPCAMNGSVVNPWDTHEGHSVFYPFPYNPASDPGDPCSPLSIVTNNSFRLHACGRINGPNQDIDYWTIDDTKNLVNVAPGY